MRKVIGATAFNIAMLRLRAALLCSCIIWCSPVSAESLQLITHPNVPVETLSRQSLWAIFGMKTRHWPDGSRIRVFVLPTEHPTHRRFSTDILNTYPYQLERAWKRLTFSGTGRAPMQLDSEQDMIITVNSTPGSIGYISTSSSKGESHVVEIQ